MKIAYFDCFAGASGDMILGSLIDAGLKTDLLKTELAKLNLHGFSVSSKKTVKGGIGGTKFDVRTGHEHAHRSLRDIVRIIDRSGLSAIVKEKSKSVFGRLAEAEAKVHRVSVDAIHFHEVGAVDAIVDITGAVAGLEALGVKKIYASPLHLGRGTVECAHGVLPVPPPAVAELVKGFPVYSTGVEGELVTPTGAAILTTLASGFGSMPAMTVEATGYGAGSKNLALPNLLRVFIGESADAAGDSVQVIETNIDDMNPQFYEHVMESLFKAGARDVYLTPVIMKKNRPGIVLSVIAESSDVEDLVGLLFRETTTLGVRISEIKKRVVLARDIVSVKTRWGSVRVKAKRTDAKTSFSPEYDDCKRIAKAKGLPISEVFDEIKRAAEKGISAKKKR
jgi:pyridinium-3,5-bisthiocarboxylic acid mononucleotide nickel chelatase